MMFRYKYNCNGIHLLQQLVTVPSSFLEVVKTGLILLNNPLPRKCLKASSCAPLVRTERVDRIARTEFQHTEPLFVNV